jgi:hypothetical protein
MIGIEENGEATTVSFIWRQRVLPGQDSKSFPVMRFFLELYLKHIPPKGSSSISGGMDCMPPAAREHGRTCPM